MIYLSIQEESLKFYNLPHIFFNYKQVCILDYTFLLKAIKYYSPLNNVGLRAPALCTVQNLFIIYCLPLVSTVLQYPLFFCICGSIFVDSTSCELCSIIVFAIEKNHVNWHHDVQTHVVRGSTL